MIYDSFQVKKRKLKKLWDKTQKNLSELEDNSNFEPIDVKKITTHNLRPALKISVLDKERNIWFGNILFKNADESFIENIYPNAVFEFRNQGISTRNIDILDGSFYYWWHKLSDTSFIFRFAADSNLDTSEPWDLTLDLFYYNRKTYDNIQKLKQ